MKTPEQLQTDILAIINNPHLEISFSITPDGQEQYTIFTPYTYNHTIITISREFLLFFPVYSTSVNYTPITVTSAKKLWQAAKKRATKDQEQKIDAAIQYLSNLNSNS